MSTNASDATPYLLIVEDESELSQMLKDHFQSLGFRVEAVENGSEALRRVMVAEFDVVICDMVMPHMAGDMFYMAVKKVRPNLCGQFIFITGHGQSPNVRDFLAGVTEPVMSKPFNIEDLTAAVRKAFEIRRVALSRERTA